MTPVRAAPVPFPDASGFRIEGDIASRSLLAAPSIPSIAHTNLLPATTVELSVWPSGFPFSAIVTGGCGFKLADQRALDLALGMRFERLPDADPDSGRETEPLTWGRIVFQWHIIAPNQTNAPPPGVAP